MNIELEDVARTRGPHVVSAGVLALLLASAQAAAQPSFTLDWHSIDGGGGMNSAGGGYAVSGTIGQPDASAAHALAGGDYTLTGGFWGAALRACTNFVGPDFDRDCDVDEDDFIAFAACADDPDVALPPACGDKDLDGDGDADSGDFAVFQRCISGANHPADPGCAE